MFQPFLANLRLHFGLVLAHLSRFTHRAHHYHYFFHEYEPWLGLERIVKFSERLLVLLFFLEKTEGYYYWQPKFEIVPRDLRTDPLYLTWHRNWHWRNILSFTTNVEHTQFMVFKITNYLKNMKTYANTDTHIKPKRSELKKLRAILNQWSIIAYYRVSDEIWHHPLK